MMGFFSFLDPVLNTVLGPLLSWPPIAAVALISFVMTLVLTLAYKFFTDQKLMKKLKDKSNEFQKKMKELKDDPEAMMRIQKQAMQTQMVYMKHSMRPTLITFLPIIIIFGWLNAHMAYDPIMAGQDVTISAMIDSTGDAVLSFAPQKGVEIVTDETQSIVEEKASWIIKADKGKYQATVEHNGERQSIPLRVDDRYYEEPTQTFDGAISSISVSLNKRIVLDLFGWKLGWLGSYIILSIFLSIGLRKVLKVS